MEKREVRMPTEVEVRKFRREWISKLYKIIRSQPEDSLTRWVRRRMEELGMVPW